MCSWGKLLGRPPAGGVYTKNSSAGGNGWPEGKNMDMGKYGTTNKGNETWVREIPVIYRFDTSTYTTVRSLTDLAAFSPVLLSAGGGQAASSQEPLQFGGCASWRRRALAKPLGRCPGWVLGGALWGVGGQAARRGVAAEGGGDASRKFAPRCEPHPARKVGPDDTDELR
eukprot:gene7676-biopygen21068